MENTQPVQSSENSNVPPPSPAHSDAIDSVNSSEHISMRARFAHIKFRPTREVAKFGVAVIFSLFAIVLAVTQIFRGVQYQEAYFGMLFWIIGLYLPSPTTLLKSKPAPMQSFSKHSPNINV